MNRRDFIGGFVSIPPTAMLTRHEPVLPLKMASEMFPESQPKIVVHVELDGKEIARAILPRHKK